jgi:carboxyl-terminal processing protease
MAVKSWLCAIVCLFSLCSVEARYPEIEDEDVVRILDDIMKVHVTHKHMTPVLARRALENFIDVLDPAKVYFTGEELAAWLNPSEELLSRVVVGVSEADFTVFEEINNAMKDAIIRRNGNEERVMAMELPDDVDVEEFQDMTWAEDEAALFERLTRLKSLQLANAEKIDDEELREKALQRVKKRRSNREDDFLEEGILERKRMVLAYVLKAFALAFDAHTAYFTPGEATQFMISVQQRLFGIGVQLRDDLSGFVVDKILEGGPANKEGHLKEKDRIIAVDGEPVVGMDIAEAVEFIRGEKGEVVKLTVLREKGKDNKAVDRLDIDIIRDEVVLKDYRVERSYESYADGVIGYVKLFSFYQDPTSSSALDVMREVEMLKREHNLKGLILDLRYNSGGLLSQAVEVAGLFITKGIVASIRDGDGRLQHLRDLHDGQVWDGPLIVLTNKASASASEIVAQTLQDYGRALIVGDNHTFGKGSFQTFSSDAYHDGGVNPQGEYKVTRGIYYTVSGKSPQLQGVQVDIIVPGALSEIEIGEQYAKFPLENDNIGENYADDLSDVPAKYREKFSRLYRDGLQRPLVKYVRYYDALRTNSLQRVEGNEIYQGFLTALKDDEIEEDFEKLYRNNDLQLHETFNIIKDFIFFTDVEKDIEAA